MRILTQLPFFFIPMLMTAQTSTLQDPLPGTYLGEYGGDQITLMIEAPSGQQYTGTMKDSQQTYAVSLHRSGSAVQGTATEPTYGLVFQIEGTLRQDVLQLHFEIDVLGQVSTMDIPFSKVGTPGASDATGSAPSGDFKVTFPAGAAHPAELIGTWTKEELYSSGYGDNYMGAGYSESWTLLAQGRMADAGNSAYISGSHYSGQGTGEGAGVIPDAGWYTIGNQLYLTGIENGQAQTYHIGKYYVEGHNMLITDVNGKKTLLTRRH